MPRTAGQPASSLRLYGRSCLRLWGESQASVVLGARWTSRMRGTLELRDVLYATNRIKRRGITRTRGEVKGWEARSQVGCTASGLRARCARLALPRIPSLQQQPGQHFAIRPSPSPASARLATSADLPRKGRRARANPPFRGSAERPEARPKTCRWERRFLRHVVGRFLVKRGSSSYAATTLSE